MEILRLTNKTELLKRKINSNQAIYTFSIIKHAEIEDDVYILQAKNKVIKKLKRKV